jgi:hypothetical protein
VGHDEPLARSLTPFSEDDPLMRHTTKWGALAALALAAGCADDRAARDLTAPEMAVANTDPRGRIYDQVEFLGNPLVAEVTIVKADHNSYNRTQPYSTSTWLPKTAAFVTGVAGRPQALAQTLGSVLYPDILVVDSAKDPSTAGWLSWALANGWGGRKLSDDVVDTGLIAIFSSLLSPTGASCAPGQLPLCTDNVGANDKPFSGAFPYLAPPTL